MFEMANVRENISSVDNLAGRSASKGVDIKSSKSSKGQVFNHLQHADSHGRNDSVGFSSTLQS
jgi:hypothetical protein